MNSKVQLLTPNTAVIYVFLWLNLKNRPMVGSDNACVDDEDLSKLLANPIASLISVPIHKKYETNVGPKGLVVG